ncbi:MAG: phage/plasmid primase, P4 family [Dehalococcoidia bacterium]
MLKHSESAYACGQDAASQTTPVDVQQAIQDYLERGWSLTPVKARTKRPYLQNWQAKTLSLEALQSHAEEGCNIGVILGPSSGGLVDVDLDSEEARLAAPYLLPGTGMVFGRGQRTTSHYLYRVDAPPRGQRFACSHSQGSDQERKTLVELRGEGGMTLLPPSTHPSGDLYAFDQEGDPAVIELNQLETDVRRVASAALIAKHWPSGQRHDCALALSGVLLRNGWLEEEVARFIEAICEAAEDEERRDRVICVQTTARRLEDGNECSGLPTLNEMLGRDVVSQVVDWLGLKGSSITKPAPMALEAQFAPFAETDDRLHDSQNAELFARLYGREARYCPEQVRWYLWDGRVWKPDLSSQVLLKAEESMRDLSHWATDHVSDRTRRGEILKWASKSRDVQPLKAMLALAQPRCAMSINRFDSDPWFLSVSNGTLDLRAGELMPHDPAHLITRMVEVEYDPQADCSRWLQFLDQIMDGDQEMARFLQRAAGYSLTGRTDEQCLFILHGDGANGKSTFLDVVSGLVGPYAAAAQADTLLAKRNRSGPREDLARLLGARMVTVSESNQSEKLDEGLVKQITGGDKLVARPLYGHPVEFKPTFKVWIATNNRPQITGTDDGIWRRVMLVPFVVSIPKEQQDHALAQKLEAERKGIFAWAVQGCIAWQKEGLNPPAKVQAAVSEYRSTSDVFSQFLEDRCLLEDEGHAMTKALYDAHGEWCELNGETALTKKTLGDRLKRIGLKPTRGKARGWQGVRLKTELEDS